MINKRIRENIAAKRKALGLPQEFIAEQLGISLNAYSKIENGPTRLVSNRLVKIAEILGVSLRDLIVGQVFTEEEYKHACMLMESKHNQDVSYYKQHLRDNELLIKTLTEMAKERKETIDYLKGKIAELEKTTSPTQQNG